MSVKFRYALVNGVNTLPNRDENGNVLHGKCSLCGGEMIAKCGSQRIKHWAHKSISECETFTRDMSDWHNDWQDKFRIDWREQPVVDAIAKKGHKADVRTQDELVIEFQHSPIKPEEQLEREEFYSSHGKGMVWVVDATRYQQLQKHFEEEKLYFDYKKMNGLEGDDVFNNYCIIKNAENVFPVQWNNRRVFVFFDYFDVEKNSGDEYLYCLFPKIIERERIILRFPRNLFVAFVSDFSNVQTYLINAFRKILNVEQEKILSIQRQKQTVGVHGFSIDLVARRQYKQRQMQEAIAKANARNNGYSNWGKKSKSCHSSNFRYRK